MQKIIPLALLTILLIPAGHAYAQEYSNTFPTLSVSLENNAPFFYQDSEGYAVVVGLVENNNPIASVSNVKIQASFYNDSDSRPLDMVEGVTSLQVIPPNGVSPYSIRSTTPNPDITNVSVSMLGFDSSISKHKELTIYSTDVVRDASLHFSGTIENGAALISDTNVYLAVYDAFDPPRILSVETIPIGNVEPNGTVDFEFSGQVDARAAGFLMVAESNIFYSDIVDVEIPSPLVLTEVAKISTVSVQDSYGTKLSELEVGSTVHIKSDTVIQIADDSESNETAYTYYVQVRESGKNPGVEYIGQYQGRFIGEGVDSQNIDWIPQKPGLYFIETFVWDRNNVSISDPGPIVLIVVV